MFFRNMLALSVAAAMSVGFTSCNEDDEVLVNTPSVNFDMAGGMQSFSVTSNTDWTISGNPSWLAVTPMQGTDNGTVTLMANANTGDARNCILYIKAGDAQATVSVSQSGKNISNGIVGTWKANFGSNSWMSFTFNANGTGAYSEYDNGHWDSNNDTFTYTFVNNIITIHWDDDYDYEEVEIIPVRSLTSTELVMNFDEEGYRTFYRQ